MMNARRVDGLLEVHVEIYDVDDHLKPGIDDTRPTGRAEGEPQRSVFAQDDGRRHRRERAFAGRNRVALALYQAELVGRSRLGREIIHLVIEQDARALGCHAGAVIVIQRVGVGNGVSVAVYDREVRRFGGLVPGGPTAAYLLALRGTLHIDRRAQSRRVALLY